MSFTQTTKLEKAKLMAFLSYQSIKNSYFAGYPTYSNPLQSEDVTALINAGKYINNQLLGTEPIAVTTNGTLTIDKDHPPQSLLYYFTGAPTSVTITSDIRTAFILINNTIDNITFTINSSNKTLASGHLLSIILKPFKSSEDTDYLILNAIIPYGFTAEDMSLKQSKGDEVKLSFGASAVQSTITEVNLPAYEIFPYFVKGHPGIINPIYIDIILQLSDIDYSVPIYLRYLQIVPVLDTENLVDSNGIYSGIPIYEINLQNRVQTSQEFVANQASKSTLTFKREAGFNEDVINVIAVED